jgi:hypothetical protein
MQEQGHPDVLEVVKEQLLKEGLDKCVLLLTSICQQCWQVQALEHGA